jgi:hypothetical protein
MKKISDFIKFVNENIDNNNLIKYSFSFPLMKKYEITDDGYWTWDELCDVIKQQSDMDLRRDVESELELEDGEEREVTDDDIDNYVNNYGKGRSTSWSLFKKDYGLEFDDNDLNRNDYQKMMSDFNESKLEQYYDSDSSYWVPFELHNLILIEPKKKGFYGLAEGTFETNIELNNDQIKSIKSYIEGQCSDGWGEGFEQQIWSEKISGINFDTTIHPWNRHNWTITINRLV